MLIRQVEFVGKQRLGDQAEYLDTQCRMNVGGVWYESIQNIAMEMFTRQDFDSCCDEIFRIMAGEFKRCLQEERGQDGKS